MGVFPINKYTDTVFFLNNIGINPFNYSSVDPHIIDVKKYIAFCFDKALKFRAAETPF